MYVTLSNILTLWLQHKIVISAFQVLEMQKYPLGIAHIPFGWWDMNNEEGSFSTSTKTWTNCNRLKSLLVHRYNW